MRTMVGVIQTDIIKNEYTGCLISPYSPVFTSSNFFSLYHTLQYLSGFQVAIIFCGYEVAMI